MAAHISNRVACMAYFAVHLIRPSAFIGFRRDKSATFSPSAEKELF
jgi:hypothetical protein